MEIILIKTDSAEWVRMWEWLGNHPLNAKLDEPTVALNNDEVWQYMGSYKQGPDVVHEFRHRYHPITGKREYLKTLALGPLTDDDVAKEITMK